MAGSASHAQPTPSLTRREQEVCRTTAQMNNVTTAEMARKGRRSVQAQKPRAHLGDAHQSLESGQQPIAGWMAGLGQDKGSTGVPTREQGSWGQVETGDTTVAKPKAKAPRSPPHSVSPSREVASPGHT